MYLLYVKVFFVIFVTMVNDELYRKIRSIRKEMGLTKRYCFATRQFLGDNGKLEGVIGKSGQQNIYNR